MDSYCSGGGLVDKYSIIREEASKVKREREEYVVVQITQTLHSRPGDIVVCITQLLWLGQSDSSFKQY